VVNDVHILIPFGKEFGHMVDEVDHILLRPLFEADSKMKSGNLNIGIFAQTPATVTIDSISIHPVIWKYKTNGFHIKMAEEVFGLYRQIPALLRKDIEIKSIVHQLANQKIGHDGLARTDSPYLWEPLTQLLFPVLIVVVPDHPLIHPGPSQPL